MDKPLTLDGQLCFSIYVANKKFNHFYQDALAPFGLTYPQFITLLALYDENAPMTVRQLGEQLTLDSGTLTPLLKRMENQGWVTRTRNHEDERQVDVTLTKKAKLNQTVLYDRVASCQALLGFDDQTMAHLKELTDLIGSKLDLVNDDHLITETINS